MKTLPYICLFIFLFSSCKQQVSGSNATNSSPNFQAGSCTIGKWSSGALPLNLKISPELVSEFTNADLVAGLNPLEQVAKVWNTAVAPNANLFQLPFATASSNGPGALNGFQDNELGIYKSHSWFSNVSSSALAITQFYGVLRSDPSLGSYIDLTHADIILNYRDFGTDFSYNGNSFVDYDVPTVVLHEMGHFLGLCHENNYNSIMAPYYFSTQRTLKTFDTNKIRALYLNNSNYGISALTSNKTSSKNAIALPEGTKVQGVVELESSGLCKHYINGKLIYQHFDK
jgi:hypothetical protein